MTANRKPKDRHYGHYYNNMGWTDIWKYKQ